MTDFAVTSLNEDGYHDILFHTEQEARNMALAMLETEADGTMLQVVKDLYDERPIILWHEKVAS